jgi:recombinational DNA repair ATPase RecF
LLNGYSRHSSFTKKSQALAEQRKEFETTQQQMANEYQQIQAERQQYVDSLQQVIEGSTANLEKYQ